MGSRRRDVKRLHLTTRLHNGDSQTEPHTLKQVLCYTHSRERQAMPDAAFRRKRRPSAPDSSQGIGRTEP